MRRLLLSTCIAITGCMTPPRPLSSPAEFIPKQRPEEVWINQNGKSFVVLDPRIEGDALVGVAENGEDAVKYPLASLTQVSARQRDKGKTTAVIVGLGVAGVAGLVLAVTQLTSG